MTRPVLKHVQVREYVRELIQGARPGTAAPSERALVQRFEVARMTVRQAMDALVVEGLLERVPGRGTFVAPPQRNATGVLSFSEDMRRRGVQPDSQTMLARREQAGPGVAKALRISEGDSVLHWQRLRRADTVPMCIENAYLNDAMLPGFLTTAMPTSLYDALAERGLRPTWAEDTVEAVIASADEAKALETQPGVPMLRIARRALHGDQVVEVSRSVYRAYRYTMLAQYKDHSGQAS